MNFDRRSLASVLASGVAGLVALALVAAPAAAQQTGAISGSVIGANNGNPLDGAQVVVEGTNMGTVSGSDGSFTLRGVPTGTQTVSVRYVGYAQASRQVDVAAGQTATVDFRLSLSAVDMEEIVVTGQGGEVERRKLGVDVASIDTDDVQDNVAVSNVGELLGGRLPGVRSTGTVGGIGTGRALRVRGTSSFQLGQRPVIYIDGVRVDANQSEWGWMSGVTCCGFSGGAGTDRLSDLNPANIQRVEVLKGAAAATMYGSEASNGVIQIFTKSGSTGRPPTFNLQLTAGVNRLRGNLRTKLYPEFTGPNGFQAWDANEHLIENGGIGGFNLSARGGGEDVTYYFSGGFRYEQGSVQPNNQKKGNLRVNLQWMPTPDFRVRANSSYNQNNLRELQSGNNWMSMMQVVVGNPRQATEDRPYGEPWISIHDIREVETYANTSRWTGGLNTNWTTTENLRQQLSLGLDYGTTQRERLMPFGHFYTYLGDVGERNIGYREFATWTADYQGSYEWQIGSDVQTQVSWGGQGFWETTNNSMATGKEFAGPGVTTVSGGARTIADEAFQETINIGFFAQNRFSFFDKLFLTTGLRVDGNSAFGEDFGLEEYPKADMAYQISREDFIPEWISTLKLRGAIGQSGLFPGAFDQFRTYQPTTVLVDQPGVTPLNPGNAQLQPERTTEIEAGFDAGLFSDRLGLDVTAYRSETSGALLEVPLPPSEGFQEAQLRNAGEVLSQGIEASLNGTPISGDDFEWSSTLNLNFKENEVLGLGPAASDGRLGDFREGYPVRSHWAYTTTGYNAQTNQHTVSDSTVYMGPNLPTFEGSLSNTLSVGNFRLYGMVSAETGAVFSNSDRSYRMRFRTGDEYLRTLDENQQPTATTDSLYNKFTLISATDSRDHVKLQELSLSYQVPSDVSSIFGMSGTSITLSGQNLYWWDDCHCADPNMRYRGGDTGSFSGFLAMPQARRVTFMLRTGF